MSEKARIKTYTVIEHLNAAVNILRSLGLPELAEEVKPVIRKLNERSTLHDPQV